MGSTRTPFFGSRTPHPASALTWYSPGLLPGVASWKRLNRAALKHIPTTLRYPVWPSDQNVTDSLLPACGFKLTRILHQRDGGANGPAGTSEASVCMGTDLDPGAYVLAHRGPRAVLGSTLEDGFHTRWCTLYSAYVDLRVVWAPFLDKICGDPVSAFFS